MTERNKMIMAVAMEMMHRVCDDEPNCYDCPFKKYCDTLNDNGMKIPLEWVTL